MPNYFAISKAISESKYEIAVIVVSDTPEGRKFVGGLGGTFVSTEIEPCTEEDFVSRLPSKTVEEVLTFIQGVHTFDSEKGKWS